MNIRLEEKRVDLLRRIRPARGLIAELSSQGEFLIQQLASLPMMHTLSGNDED